MTQLETPDRKSVVYYAAVGIPQGIIIDPASGEPEGVIRTGQSLVSIDRSDYVLWAHFVRPMTVAMVNAAVAHPDLAAVVARFESRGWVVPIEPGRDLTPELGRTCPVPLGIGLGNEQDSETFRIQSATSYNATPISLNTIEILFWWLFDGTRTLRECSAEVANRVPALESSTVGKLAVRTTHMLMAERLLYLDRPPTPNEEPQEKRAD